ncbi:MAG: GreA/GreB family elongation factor [Verrucomicrobia bacterium]|nr:GreA/GreB family elongation factor [Verrucomicrobiota bacterium]
MSRAFVRESDDLPERPALARRAAPLPPGAPNYITPDGARRFREELERLAQVERPRLVAADDSESKRQLQKVNQRIDLLQQCFESAVVVSPPGEGSRVQFGATVTVREHSDGEACYRIVGVDEVDIDRGWVSWLSPIARALLNARLGERVRFKSPAGEQELEIVAISYE